MIACLNVPFFATAVEERDNPENQDGRKPDSGLVLGGQPWEPRPVYAYSREVARLGVRPGMSLRLAHILSPEARFMEAAPPKYMSASGEVTDILADFTHLIEPDELWLDPNTDGKKGSLSNFDRSQAFGRTLPARYTLDLESLPADEAISLVKEMGSAVRRHTHLSPAIGLAESKFTAQVAATVTHQNHARAIPPGEENHFLASQSIQFLPLEKEAARRLSLLGIRTLGQLASMPNSTLHAQFGSEFAALYRRAQRYAGIGDYHLHNPLRTLAPERRERADHHFEDPISNLLILERVLSRLAADLAGRLQAARLEVRTIRLALELESGLRLPLINRQPEAGQEAIAIIPGNDHSILASMVTRRYPTSSLERLEETLRDLLHQLWENRTQGENGADARLGIMALSVEFRDLTPAVSIQQLLFSRLNEPDKQTRQAAEQSGAETIVQDIAARHGKDHFFRPEITDRNHPLPERRFQMRESVPV